MNTLTTFFSVILFAGHWFISATNNAAVIIAKPQNATVEEGNELILKCLLSNKTAQCLWSKNGTTFKSSDNGYQYANDDDCTIKITNASCQIHDAFYRCGQSWNEMSDPPTKVSVLVRPQNPEIHYNGNTIRNGDNLTVAEGESYVTLKCMVRNGNPEASIQWIMDSKELAAKSTITSSKDNILKTAQSELILHAKDSHLQHRTLQCNAIHPLYNGSNNMISTQVKIILPGVVVNVTAGFVTNTLERSIIATVGSFVVMNCNAIGDPILEYVWEKKNSEKPVWEVFDSKSTTTHIAEEGKFRCGAKSKNKNLNYVYSEELQVELDTSHILTVIAHPKDAIVKNSDDVYLQCIFSRRPFSCDWLRDEHPFIPDGDLYIFVGDIQSNDCSIMIKSANANFEATYTCESPAVGMQGGAISNTAKVTIQNMPQSPEIWYQESVLETGDRLKINYNATAITVYCRVKDANPAAQIKWFVNNVEHYGFVRHETSSANRYWITTTNILNITITEDMKYKKIRCGAFHAAYIEGRSETYAIMSIPSPTTQIRAYIPEINTTNPIVIGPEVTITLFCDANGDPDPYYEWKFHQLNSNDWWILPSNEKSINVTNKPGTYTCTARNEHNTRNDLMSNEITIEIKYPHEVNLGALVGAAAACIFVVAISLGITLYAFSHQILCFKKSDSAVKDGLRRLQPVFIIVRNYKHLTNVIL